MIEVPPEEQEVFEEKVTDLSVLKSGALPEYLKQLEMLQMTDEEKLDILSVYDGAAKRKFTLYVNQVVTILGAVVWSHPPTTDAKGNRFPAYEQIYLLTDKCDENDVPIVIACAFGSLAPHLMEILDKRGWFIWEKPVRYRLLNDGNGTPFRMINEDRLQAMKTARKK